MNIVDFLVIACVIAFGVRGYRRGMVRECIEVASAAAGLWAAYHTAGDAGAWVSMYTTIPASVTSPILFVLVALIVASIGFGLAALIHRAVTGQAPWRRMDGWLGIVFGTMKGLVICGIVLVVMAQLSIPLFTSALENSMTGRSMFRMMPQFYHYVDLWMGRTG